MGTIQYGVLYLSRKILLKMWTIATNFIDRGELVFDAWINSFENLDIDKKEFGVVWVDFSGKMEKHYLRLKEKFKEFTYIKRDGENWKECQTLNRRFLLAKRKKLAENINFLIRQTQGNVLFWEDDIIVKPNFFKELLKDFEKEDVEAITCVQYNRAFDTQKLLLWELVEGIKVFGKRDTCKETNYLSVTREINFNERKEEGVEVIGASATGFILYKEDFIKNHIFDNYYHRGQDICACMHIRERGKKVLINWGLIADHVEERDKKLLIWNDKISGC